MENIFSILVKTMAIVILILTIGPNVSYTLTLEKEIDSLKVLITKNHDNYNLYFYLGLCYESLMKYDEAESILTKVLTVKKNYKTAIIKLAKVYGHLGKYEQMQSILNKFNDVADTNGYTFLYLSGIASSLLGKYGDAKQYFNLAIKKGNEITEADISLILAMIYLFETDTIQSNYSLANHIEHYANTSEITSRAYYRLGYFDAAIKDLTKQKTDNDLAGWDLYNLGVFMIAGGDKSGLEKLKMASDKNEDAYYKAAYAAVCFIKRDSLLAAEQTLLDSYESGSGICNGLLAWICENTGRSDRAKMYWYNCFGLLPLGINVEQMRAFMNKFVETIKN